MFFTAVRQAFYKTRWSRHPSIINIDSDVMLQWNSTTLWVIKQGHSEIPLRYNSASELEKEVENIISTFNQNNTSDKMIQYLEMRDAERKMKKFKTDE